MPYPFVNFGGVPLPKEWQDCGYSSKPSSIAAYGSTVRTAINMSNDDWNNPQIQHRLNFGSATRLNTWSMEIVMALSGSPDGKITLFRCINDTQTNRDSYLEFDRGRVKFVHGTLNRSHTLTKQLDQSGPSRIMTIHIVCNEDGNDVNLYVDGESQDEKVSTSGTYTNQPIGTAPSYMLMGNVDSQSFPPHRGNIMLYDFKFSANYFFNVSGSINQETGQWTPSTFVVSSNPASFAIKGELVEVQPSAEVIKYTSPSIHTFSKFNRDAILFTTPHISKHGVEQGKVSLTRNSNSVIEHKYDKNATRTAARANFAISGGVWKMTGHSTQANTAALGDSPTGGVDIQTVNIPSNATSMTINHSLGKKPIAAILVDSSGNKFFASEKSDIMRPVIEDYNGASFASRMYSPFCLRTANTSSMTFLGRTSLLGNTSRYTEIIRSPRVVDGFTDEQGRSYAIFATNVGHWDDTIHMGQNPGFFTYEITSTGLTKRHSMTDSTLLPRAKHVSILKDKSTGRIYMHVFVKATGWRQDATGYTSMYAFRWEAGSKTWTMVQKQENVNNTRWLDPTTSTADADARQLIAWKSADIHNSTTTENIIGVAVYSDNPPGGATSGGGGGGTFPPDPGGIPGQSELISDIDQEPGFSDRSERAFGTARGDSRPVKIWISTYRQLGLDNIPIPGGYAGGVNSYRRSEFELNFGDDVRLQIVPEISIIPIAGENAAIITVGVKGSQSEVVEQFYMDSTGSILKMGNSGFEGNSISNAWNYQTVGLTINGNETWLFETSANSWTTTTGHGKVTASRLVVENVSSAPLRYRKEFMGSFSQTRPVGYLDAVQFQNETYVVLGCPTVGGSMNMHVMKYDYSKNSFDHLHSIGTWAYINSSGSAGKLDISGYHRPKLIVNGNNMYLAVSTDRINNDDIVNNRRCLVFQWNATSNSFVNSWLMSDMNHGVAAGTAKLILFTEGASVTKDDDLPFRSSAVRAAYQFELGTVDIPWGNELPHCALDDYMRSSNVGLQGCIFQPDLNQKEMVAVTNFNTGSRGTRSISYGDQSFIATYDYFHKKIAVGVYGHFNTEEDGKGIPFWFNPSNTHRSKSFQAGTRVEMFRDRSDQPCIAVSNWSGTNGRIAVAKVSPTARTMGTITELPTKSGRVIDMRRVHDMRIGNSNTNMVAVCFQSKTDGAQIHLAGIDARLDGGFSTNSTGWASFGGYAHSGSANIAFDICVATGSSRFTCCAAVDSSGRLHYWVNLTTNQTTPLNPSETISPGGFGVNRYGGSFDKAKDVKIFSDGGNTYMYVFCNMSGNTADHSCGHVVMYKLNTASWKFERQGHVPEMHYSKMADRPFKWNNEWYWYGGVASETSHSYPFGYTEAEQSMCIFKFIPEKGSFTTSPLWSGVETPLVFGIPRYNTTSEYDLQAHPIIASYAGGKMAYGLLNTDSLVIDDNQGKGFFYRPSRYNVEYFGGVPFMAPDLDGPTGANSAYGAGGNDMVLKIAAGSGFASPFTGFITDYRWEEMDYPFIENWKSHYYPTPTGLTGNDTDQDDESVNLANGNTKFQLDALIQRDEPGMIVTPLIFPGKHRKSSGKLYFEAGFHNCDIAPTELAEGAFIIEGGNEGQYFGHVRNSNAWSPATGGFDLTGSYPVDGNRRDFMIGYVFDYDNDRIQTYINGTLRTTYTMPSFDMRVRGMLRKAYGPLQTSYLTLNFGQIPFTHTMPSGTQTVSGATLAGTYRHNYISTRAMGKIAASTSSGSTTTVPMISDADVVFLLASTPGAGGSHVVLKDVGYEYRFDLDGTNGAVNAGGAVITDLSNGYRINHSRWSSGSFDFMSIGLSAQTCYGVFVHTYTGNGINGSREIPVELANRPTAALILPHTSGETPYWVFYSEGNGQHYYLPAGATTNISTSGWATGPFYLTGTYDGRATIATAPSGSQPNFNRSGRKYSVVFFADTPGILNVRTRGQTITGINEAQSLDTNVKAGIFASASTSSSYTGPWQYWCTDIYDIDDPSSSSAGSGVFVTEGSWRFLRARASGSPEFNGDKSPVRFSEGVMIHGGYNTEAYPAPGATRSEMKYFGIYFGDGPLIYSPSSKK
ncbi:hypothetical protein SM033_00138 [Vibrio phage vB_VpaM_sm033]|nr:hypothetical protein SM033_00138 [Vibrio phage vB_VpaM_sm033]